MQNNDLRGIHDLKLMDDVDVKRVDSNLPINAALIWGGIIIMVAFPPSWHLH